MSQKNKTVSGRPRLIRSRNKAARTGYNIPLALWREVKTHVPRGVHLYDAAGDILREFARAPDEAIDCLTDRKFLNVMANAGVYRPGDSSHVTVHLAFRSREEKLKVIGDTQAIAARLMGRLGYRINMSRVVSVAFFAFLEGKLHVDFRGELI